MNESIQSRPGPDPAAADARRSPTRRDLRVDLWVAALSFTLGLITLWLSTVIVEGDDTLTTPGPVESTLWLIALCAPLAFRRRRPITVLSVVSAVFLAAQLRGYADTLTPSIVEFIAIFTANAWAARRARALVVSIVVTVAMFVWLAVWLRDVYASEPTMPDGPTLASIVYTLVYNGIVLVTAIAFGRAARVSAARLHALEQAGVELRVAQELVADRAIAEERTRIARELHDVVAHNVAVIGIQAGAARRTLHRPEIARGALAAVEGTARTTIDELERLLSVLRTSDTATPAGPSGLSALPELVAATRALGLDVRFGVHGTPRTIPESIGVTVFRIAQEALTNTLKHGHASSADVRLRYRDRAVEIEITDDGRSVGPAETGSLPSGTATPATSPAGAGLGQRGMRERVDLHGGELHLGPRDRGGYRVRAALPVGTCSETADVATGSGATGTVAEPHTDQHHEGLHDRPHR